MCSVLIADDDALVRLVLRSALEQRGCVVTEAADGEELLSRMTPEVDLLLMDAGMPGPGLNDRLARARRMSPTGAVIVLSGSASASVEALDAGAGFLGKPLELRALEAELDRVRLSCSGAC
jgi:two-component system OmpR family response regulator